MRLVIMQKVTIKPHCHLVEFLYQSEVEAAETVVAVQGYLKEYHWRLFTSKNNSHYYMHAYTIYTCNNHYYDTHVLYVHVPTSTTCNI